MIYDTFLFFNELELLEVRLHELDAVVDRFVLVESRRTHSNQPKNLVFQENRHRFEKYADKIIHVIVDDTPDTKDSWIIEGHDRRAIDRGLKNCRPDDLILMSDLDEIPRAEAVREACARLVFGDSVLARTWSRLLRHPLAVNHLRNPFKKYHPLVTVFEQRLYYYFLDCQCDDPAWWPGTRMVFFRDYTSAYDLRRWSGRRVRDAGWHFSYMGGVERIRQKLAAYAHQEFNRAEFTDPNRIAQLIGQGRDILGDGKPLRWVKLDDSYPRLIRENPGRFASWLGSPSWPGA